VGVGLALFDVLLGSGLLLFGLDGILIRASFNANCSTFEDWLL